jgi:NitT/TauT family transport system permease protein
VADSLAASTQRTRTDGQPRKRGRSWTRRFLTTVCPAVAVVVLALLAWQAYVELADVRDVILPPPTAVFSKLIHQWSVFQPELLVTAKEALQGLLIATVGGFLLGVAITSSRILRVTLYPLIITSQAIPIIAIAPLLITWLGFGASSKIAVSALIAFFPVTVSTAAGLASLEAGAVSLMQSFPAGRLQIFVRARLPNALPQIFSGLKVAAVLAVVGAVVGEWVGSDSGLGYLIVRQNALLATDTVFACVVLLAGLGIAFFLTVVALEWLVLPWNRT